MTTGWLLLLLLVVSSQSVDSQSTTDDETCDEAGLVMSELKRDIEQHFQDHQQQLFQMHQTVLDNQQQIFQMLQQYQTILNRLGKFLIVTTFS